MSSLGRRGNKILQGMAEAVSVSKGEQPATRITWHGHAYVPLAEYERLRDLVREVIYSANGDIRRDPGPSEILAETGWYERAKEALGMVPAPEKQQT